ncbi:C4-dicarboxylate ABC transporter substrate-binding protein [Pararhodobacter marinus]|uniref:C4-dicarboxylate ABC transporter substrate-binding protein n=1 Tax=Pararhodobacter marinus TaxID=2184063 RepID=A0A2U2CAQ4_9RHOB|nr:C4-dicarboxylate TRAP transporter substrate-binding protein [Pararhodobacter marinus]PWE28921.1 C4-dicarboxylate ABC transporter substrate-binding protein [Pararhodobacter marinus]
MKALFTMALAGTTALTIGTAAEAQYLFSSWLEPNHVITREAHMQWAEDLAEATDGEVAFEVIVGGALIPAQSTMQGVADGLAQAGFHTATYTPSDLPVSNAVADMGFITPDPFVMAFAWSDFMMNEPAGFNDWRDNGVLFGGGYAVPEYNFICREPLSTLADFEGKRVRMPGGGWARFGQAIGVVGVNVPSNEIYTAFERGSVDCTASDTSHLTGGATLMEVAGGVTTLAMSPFYAGVTWAYNPDFWAGLTPEQRRTVFDVSAESLARLQVAYAREASEARDAAAERGIPIVEPDASLQEAYDAWVADGVGDMAGIAASAHGIEDPQALFDSFQGYVDKWVGLLDGLEQPYTVEDLTALLQENLYGPIDVNTWGLE